MKYWVFGENDPNQSENLKKRWSKRHLTASCESFCIALSFSVWSLEERKNGRNKGRKKSHKWCSCDSTTSSSRHPKYGGAALAGWIFMFARFVNVRSICTLILYQSKEIIYSPIKSTSPHYTWNSLEGGDSVGPSAMLWNGIVLNRFDWALRARPWPTPFSCFSWPLTGWGALIIWNSVLSAWLVCSLVSKP